MVDKTETPLYSTREVVPDRYTGGYGGIAVKETVGPEDSDSWANNPNEQLGFEIDPLETEWSFAPEYYPEDFTSVKKREFDRYGNGCGGESVSIKSVKNREFHARGVMTTNGLAIFNHLIDYDNEVDIISPIIRGGGMECYIKKAEVGNEAGVDPLTKQRLFEYTLDLVSTGRDEHFNSDNGIVTAIVNG